MKPFKKKSRKHRANGRVLPGIGESLMEVCPLFTRTILAAGLAAALLASGFAPAQAQTPAKWKHGILDSKADAGFFYMAQEKGFFRKRGLDVEYIELRGERQAVRALLANELDSAETAPGGPLSAIDAGADIRFIGSTMPGLPYALYARKDIQDWADLKGRTFGVSAPGAIPDIIARMMLQRKGVDPNSIRIANAGGTSGRIQALVGGKIDATAAATDFVPEAGKLGIKVMGYAADIVPEYPRYVLTARVVTLQQKREQAINFLAAYMEGLDYALKNREETLRLTGKINNKPADDPKFVYLYDEAKSKGYVSATSEIPRAKIEWLQNEMLRLGDLKKKIDLDRVIDESFRKEALKRVGVSTK